MTEEVVTEKVDAGRLIRQIRHRLGWSQKRLADRAGTTQSAIARLENGGRSPTVVTLVRVFDALNYSLALDARPKDYGFDRSLIKSQLAKTPLQCLRDLKAFVSFVAKFRGAVLR